MPRCGATFDESVPPWTRGTSGGFGRNAQPGVGCRSENPPRCCATAWSLLETPPSRHPSDGEDFHKSSQRNFQRAGRRFLGIFSAMEPATVTTSYSPW